MVVGRGNGVMNTGAQDNPERAESVPEARTRNGFPWPVAIGLFGGACILLSGWATYVTGKNNALMEARSEKVEIQINDVKARQDRLEARLLFLEQNRAAITDDDMSHVFGNSIVQTDPDTSTDVNRE